MSNSSIVVYAIVEGKTEEQFVKDVLAPYLGDRGIFMYASQVTKSGEKGGDVKFSRVKRDIRGYLTQQADTYVTTLIDYYGVKEWPATQDVRPNATPAEIADIINTETKRIVDSEFERWDSSNRFIPYMAIHEFEALLFSDSAILARSLGVAKSKIDAVLSSCDGPEAINNSPQTAPSKRLDSWSDRRKFPKTTDGIQIAKEIGIETMRQECHLFDEWLTRIESIGNR
jgi:hypothetical protein